MCSHHWIPLGHREVVLSIDKFIWQVGSAPTSPVNVQFFLQQSTMSDIDDLQRLLDADLAMEFLRRQHVKFFSSTHSASCHIMLLGIGVHLCQTAQAYINPTDKIRLYSDDLQREFSETHKTRRMPLTCSFGWFLSGSTHRIFLWHSCNVFILLTGKRPR